eukprot:1886464-Amphidinium_carterae.1
MTAGMDIPGHRDARNRAGSMNWVLPMGDYHGGSPWWIDEKGKEHTSSRKGIWHPINPLQTHGVTKVEHGLR